jgi:hypothetical protein
VFRARGGVFFLQLVYLAGLGALAGLFFNGVWIHRETLGTVPIAVPWWGALGGVLLSLTGVFDHKHDWQRSYAYWHWARPLVGLVIASFVVLVFQAGVLAVGKDLKPAAGVTNAQNLFYYVLAFIVGYREETARALIKRVSDVMIGPGDAAPPAAAPAPAITALEPASAAAGTEVQVTGTGLGTVQAVSFGGAGAVFSAVSDTQLTVTVPAGGPGAVSVVFTLQDGTQLTQPFTYV